MGSAAGAVRWILIRFLGKDKATSGAIRRGVTGNATDVGIRQMRSPIKRGVLKRRVSVTDPRGAKTQVTYDLLNRVTAVADPLGAAVRFQYDPNSNLTKVIDPRGGEIAYAYDNMDQFVTRTDQLLRQETFGYDVGGHLTSYTDRKNQVTTWSPYDDLNRHTTVTFQGGATLTYGYDAANRLQTLTDSLAGAITWVYDALDRMTSETTPQGTVTYGLDDADRRTSMLVAGQLQVGYAWDNADRLTDITRGSLAAHYGYDNANRRTSLQLPNLVTIAYGYDDANRLASLTYSGLVGGNQSLAYSYDVASNRTLMSGSWARTLLPDAISSASYDLANRQLALGNKTMTYDNNGSLETLTEGGNTTTYTWDARKRLAAINGPGFAASFMYDAVGRRARKTVAGFSTDFQYDRQDIVRAVEGGATVNYLRGIGVDQPLARITDSDSTCYLDALNSTWALSDMSGTVTTSYTYTPFGQTTITGAASNNAFRYTGREEDGAGHYYYRNRYYMPAHGRFLSEDPVGLSGGDYNLYRYVFNAPTRLVDPLGLAAQVCCRPAFPGGGSLSPGAFSKYKHCFVKDDQGQAHSFVDDQSLAWANPERIVMYYTPGYELGKEWENPTCRQCLPNKCEDPIKQRQCFKRVGEEISGYPWNAPRQTSNSGAGELARRCCAGGVPADFTDEIAPGIGTRLPPEAPEWPLGWGGPGS